MHTRVTSHMNQWMMRCTALMLILVIGPGLASSAYAASMNPKLLPNVKGSTFEVVAAKPTHDPLTYARKLPMNLLPYQQRKDKYYSIGTAFAIGHNHYVTAGHVLMIGLDSLWGPLALRDASGKVYAIDKIQKFSLHKDFVMFSLKHPPGEAAFKTDTKPDLNQVVYAVGNALGTGVVIRDGLFTSRTPEQQAGKWKWIRFSAAASPGNSGGPLLNKQGQVIGVVLRKSANENLNYALPIGEVLDAPDNKALIDQRVSYQFDVFDTTLHNMFKGQFNLPLSPSAFFKKFDKLQQAYSDQQLKALLSKESATLFPNGKGSNKLLHEVPSMRDQPSLIARDNNGEWGLAGTNGKKISLSDNGYITVGSHKHDLLFHLRKPDSISSARLYHDPEQLVKLIAKTGHLKRRVGSDHVKITSLGQPTRNRTHTDRWQRNWQIRVWPLPYANTNLIVMSLPVPDGYAGMMLFAPASQTHDYLINAEALSDFMYVTYDGTLKQWKGLLAERDLLPAAFKHIKIDYDYGKHFDYASRRLKLNWTPKLQKIQPESVLTLGFSFFKDKSRGKVVWDVADVWAAPNPYDKDAINVARKVEPTSDMQDSFKSSWHKVEHRRHPYDGVARNDDDIMKITGVAGPEADTSPQVLYPVYYHREGAQPQTAMTAKLKLLMDGLKIQEK